MRTLRLTASILLVSLTLFPLSRANASCVQMSLKEQVATADVVGTGKITKINQPITGGSTITIELDTIYKGTPSNPVTIASDSGRTSRTSVDVNFQEGASYLFLLATQDNKNYTTNMCLGTRTDSRAHHRGRKMTLGAGTPAPAVTATPSGWDATMTAGFIALLAVALGVGAIKMTLKGRKAPRV